MVSFPSGGAPSSRTGGAPHSFSELASVKHRVETGWYDRHPHVLDATVDRLAADLGWNLSSPCRGGQGRSARDVADSARVLWWLVIGALVGAAWAAAWNLI